MRYKKSGQSVSIGRSFMARMYVCKVSKMGHESLWETYIFEKSS